MKLIGPWLSGPTRRVGVTLKLLGIPFEHLPLHAYLERDLVLAYSPMGKVPALLLDDGRTLFDSWAIIDYLHEMVGPERALIPQSGVERQQALQYIGIADAIYGKLSELYDESLRPEELRVPSLIERWIEQLHVGLDMLDRAASQNWLVGCNISQADIFAVIVYEMASRAFLPEQVNGTVYPRLEALMARVMLLPQFAETSLFS